MYLLNNLIVFAVTLFLLLKATDVLIDASSRLARILHISDLTIGFFILALGTSLPELASSLASVFYNQPAIIIGNIVGSNIANIGLVLGIGAIMTVINVPKRVFYKDGLFLLSISLLMFFFSLNFSLNRMEGLIFLSLYVGYVLYLFGLNPFKKVFNKLKLFTETVEQEKAQLGNVEVKKLPLDVPILVKEIILIVVTLWAIYFSVKYLIPSLTSIAGYLGIPQIIIALTMLAVGTSLPELIVTIKSVHKKKNDLMIGNLLGSNVANILLIGGVSATIKPITFSPMTAFYLIPVMLFFTIMLLVFIRSRWYLRLFEGLLFLILYILFIASLMLF